MSGAYQLLNLGALLVPQLPACHIRSFATKSRVDAIELQAERCVTHGPPSAVMEDFESSILRTAIHRDSTVCEPNAAILCTDSLDCYRDKEEQARRCPKAW